MDVYMVYCADVVLDFVLGILWVCLSIVYCILFWYGILQKHMIKGNKNTIQIP